MHGFRIHTGNRLEILLQRLARELRQPLASVFEKEIIITQSPGMARWIAMGLAGHNSINGNTTFPFPNAFLKFLCEKLYLGNAEDDPFDPEVLTFRIMQKLPECLSRPAYEGLRSYFSGDNRQIKLLQLSQKIAYLFDQYLVFRPDLIFAWEKGRQTSSADQAWQADLWREVASGHAHLHRAKKHAEILAKLVERPAELKGLPQRVSVFGISYLPVFHLQVLSALSNMIQVNCFLLNPCRQYWGEVVSSRDIRRIRQQYIHKPGSEAELHLDKGNRLLSSLGMLGRDFLSIVAELGCDIIEHYRSPGRDNLLCMIQSDILDMTDPVNDGETIVEPGAAQSSPTGSPQKPSSEDLSIEIHACHSIMREIEVLHDSILDMLEQDPDLQTRDILVMTPDIETLAPLVEAVFDNPTGAHPSIPFSLADRTVFDESQVIESFFALLDLAGSRLEASRITELLAIPMIRERFDLSEQDVATLETWIKELNIRWGIDATSKQELGLPSIGENTWQRGLDRLLLGYAMPGKGHKLFSGILPYDAIEGDQARILGNFMEFFEGVIDLVYVLDKAKPMQAWSDAFVGVLDGMFAKNESTQRELQVLQRLIGDLAAIQRMSAFEDPIEFDALVYYLKQGLQKASFGTGFISGGVTFCAMLPMRSIPFKVICLVGMRGDAFPRDTKTLGFDLMAAFPRPGDRSKRNDDKYLFLEALISARKKFYISYTGRDIQDNAAIAPAVLVSELLDYIKEGYGIPENQIVKEHPLQAFSSEYFNSNPRLFSYSKENFLAAKAGQRNLDVVSLLDRALPEPSMANKNLDAEILGIFFANPVKFLIQKRLGIFLEEGSELPEEREDFRLDGLKGYRVGLETLDTKLKGDEFSGLLPVLKGRGLLPHGRVGEHEFAAKALETDDFMSRLENWVIGKEPRGKVIDIQFDDFTIRGNLPNMYENCMVQMRYVKFNPKDVVKVWIDHLLLNIAEKNSGGSQSIYLCRDATIVFEPIDNGRHVLAYLLDQYWRGLSVPLHFFPKSAYAYAEKRQLKQGSRQEALRSAGAAMQGNRFVQGEIAEPYTAFYVDGLNPLDEDFENIALNFFKPLFDHYERLPA